MRTSLARAGRTGGVSGILLWALSGCSDSTRSQSKPVPAPEPLASEEAKALASAPLGHAVSVDARGSARWAAGSLDDGSARAHVSAESAARIHLSRHARVLGVAGAVASEAVLTDSLALSGGGGVFRFAQ